LGAEVYRTNCSGHQSTLDISTLPPGTYTLQAKSSNTEFNTKFTKE
jgi:hypothetical protein